MGVGCFECREDKLKKAKKMTNKLFQKLKSESEELEEKIMEDTKEWMNIKDTPGASKTKKINLFLDIYSNIQLYKKKITKMKHLKRNSNLIEDQLDEEKFVRNLKEYNGLIQEGVDYSEDIRENIQLRKDEEARLRANDALLKDADNFGSPALRQQEINNFMQSDYM